MLTDKNGTKVFTNKVLIPRNPRQISFSNQVNNVSINQPAINNNQKLFLLKVTDDKKQPHYIRLPNIQALKVANNKPNFDLKLEKVNKATHVLDHSYAAYQQSNGTISKTDLQPPTSKSIKTSSQKPLILIGQSSKQNVPLVLSKTNVETKQRPILIKPVPFSSNTQKSDKEIIAVLKNQLKVKTSENQLLQKNLKKLHKESKVIVKKRLQDTLKNVFSSTQIDKLLNPYKAKVKWTVEDIISALTLQNISLRAYSYLRENNYPLPGLSTIRKWTAQISLTEGIIKDVLVIMKFRAKSLTVFQKTVILYFEEFSISNERCLFCLASGLFHRWMQPIYYSRNKTLSFNIIKDVISQLYNVGFIVVAITCNLEYQPLWTQMDIGIRTGQKCYFYNPKNPNLKVFVFPDEDHLLKLLRKQFLNEGIYLKQKHINKQCIEELSAVSKKLEAAKFFKTLNEAMDDCKTDKTKARLLFTRTIAEKLFSYGQEGYIPYKNWKEAAKFFDTMSKWIGLFSAKSCEHHNVGEEPYGLNLEEQNNILNDTKELMYPIKTEGQSISSFSVHNQIIIRGNSLQELFHYLKETLSSKEFPIKYILTSKLSSECLKNIMGYLSSSDGANSKPQEFSEVTQAKLQNKLRKCILGKYLTDTISCHNWKILDPCIIDFKEKSDSTILMNDAI